MKTIIFTHILLLACLTNHAQTETLEWALSFSGDFESVAMQEGARQVAADSEGNVYVTGTYTGNVDFDPGDGTFNLNSIGAFILKLSASGALIWAKQMAGNDLTAGLEIALDDAGNIYVAGRFEGTTDFDPGPGVFNMTTPSVFSAMIFVVKLDNSGDFVWARSYGDGATEFLLDMSIDASGNVLMAGIFGGTIDFDPGPGMALTSSVGASSFAWDGFVVKWNSQGNFEWVSTFAGVNTSETESVTTDAAGNVYCTGKFEGPVDFDPGSGVLEMTAVASDAFMVKLNSSGDLIWAKFIVGPNGSKGSSIRLDEDENIILAGEYTFTADFDPGANVFNLTSAGNFDVFVAKYTNDGNLIWAKSIGGPSVDNSPQLAIGPMGEAIVTGGFWGLSDFDPGAGVFNLESATIDKYDVFVSKLDADGNFLGAYGIIGKRQNLSFGITATPDGSTYTVGSFEARAAFGTPDEPYELRAAGGSDIYILKMSGCGNPTTFLPDCPDCDGVINGFNRPGTLDIENEVPVLINYECESTPVDLNAPCTYFMSVYDSIGGIGFGLSTIYQLYFDPTPGSQLVLMAEIWQVTYRASLAYDAENQLLYAVALDLPLLEVLDLQNYTSYPVFDPQTQSVTRKTGATWHDGLLYVAAESPRKIYTYDVNTGNSALLSPGLIDGGDIVFDSEGTLLLLSQGPRQAYAVNVGGLNDHIGSIPSSVQGAMTGPDGSTLLLVKGSRFLRSLGADGEMRNTSYSLTHFGLPFIPGEGDLASGCSGEAGLVPASAVASSNRNPVSVLSSQPNPASDVSIAAFTVFVEQRTTLEVYDLSGRLVKNLYDAVAQAGLTYRIPFETAQLPAGVYIYRLTTENETVIEKFMVTK